MIQLKSAMYRRADTVSGWEVCYDATGPFAGTWTPCHARHLPEYLDLAESVLALVHAPTFADVLDARRALASIIERHGVRMTAHDATQWRET